jgi:hypothetical protein
VSSFGRRTGPPTELRENFHFELIIYKGGIRKLKDSEGRIKKEQLSAQRAAS